MSLVVKATLEGQILKASAFHVDDGCQIAFYVYRGATRIHVQWYSDASHLEFDTKGTPGYYRALAFVRRGDAVSAMAYSNPVFACPTVTSSRDFPFERAENMAFMVRGCQWTFPTLYYPGSEKRLFVMLSSAVNREKVTLPAFHRWTWAERKKFPGEVLCIADPTLTLHPALRLGWYLGTLIADPMPELTSIVATFAQTRGIASSNIVAWGSSAGGFAALSLAARIPGATAVAINSQTDPLSYIVTSQVELVRKLCFRDKSDIEIRRDYAHRIDAKYFFGPHTSSRAILVQNERDRHHFDIHFTPFWRAHGGKITIGWSSCNQHSAWLYTDESGHAPETSEMADELISRL